MSDWHNDVPLTLIILDDEGEKAWTEDINIDVVERAVNTITIITNNEAANFDFTTDIIIVLCLGGVLLYCLHHRHYLRHHYSIAENGLVWQ